MDLTFVSSYYVPVVLLACLCVGYCIKNISWLSKVSNEYIPTIMLVLGAILCCISRKSVDFDTIVAGAVTGLASTGLHQGFKLMIQNKMNGSGNASN